MSDNWEEAQKYIYENTNDVRHGNSSFYKHLWKVHDILKHDMKQEDYLCKAGLFHSIYGTSYFKNFKDETLTRDIVKGWIGEKAENLVYEFCETPDRIKSFLNRSGNWSDELYKDLLTIEVANLKGQNTKKYPRTIEVKRRMKQTRKIVDTLYDTIHSLDKKKE